MTMETLQTPETGAAIIVDGQVVAWFAQFTEEAREWCTENYFGKWLVWGAKSPELIPMTKEEHTAALREAAELAKQFKQAPAAE